MPTYDYECPNGHNFEAFQKMTDEPVTECPECSAPASRKISGGAGFLFKGEGFYITDHRSEDYKKKASDEGRASSTKSSESESSGSSDSKQSDKTSSASDNSKESSV